MTSEEIEARIAALEVLRDAELAATSENTYIGRRNAHSVIKQKYACKISCLRKYGVESPLSVSKFIRQRMQTMHNTYGAGCNIDKMLATKQELYGNAFGPSHKILATKVAKFGNGHGDVSKTAATKLERYGCVGNVNIEQSLKTKEHRYGNHFGDVNKMRQTTQQMYGVDWPCQLPQCRLSSKTISKCNMMWHDALLRQLAIDTQYEFNINNQTYDLQYEPAKLLIEICPTVTHNCTVSFAYLTGRAKDNNVIGAQYHYNKTKLALDAGYRCITVFDWDSQEEVINLIADIIAGTEQLKTTDTIEIDLSKESPLNYPDYTAADFKINCHTCMLGKTEVDVYDCGHLTMTRSNTK